MQALPPRRVTVLQRSDKNRLKKPYRNASKSTRPPKRSATTKVTYCKLLRKTQGQASFLDRHVRNMENRRGPLNRRIKNIPFCSNWIVATAHLVITEDFLHDHWERCPNATAGHPDELGSRNHTAPSTPHLISYLKLLQEYRASVRCLVYGQLAICVSPIATVALHSTELQYIGFWKPIVGYSQWDWRYLNPLVAFFCLQLV